MKEINSIPADLPAYIVMPYPLYVSIEQAAKIAGVSKDDMTAFVNADVNPIEHIKTGRNGGRVRVRVSAIEPYLERRAYTNVSI